MRQTRGSAPLGTALAYAVVLSNYAPDQADYSRCSSRWKCVASKCMVFAQH